MATSGGSVVLHGAVLEESEEDFSFEDICRACAAQGAFVTELVEEEVLIPLGGVGMDGRFSGLHLRRARVAVRLNRDLGVNAAGAALALQLMEEIEQLRARLHGLGAR